MSKRVLKIKLRVLNRAKQQRLLALQAEYTACAQFHLQAINDLGTDNTTKLHRAVYQQARDSFDLKAAMLQRARDKAIEAWKSHLAQIKRGKKSSVPRFNDNCPIGLTVDIVAANNGILCVEKLLGIRDRTKFSKKLNRMVHGWPFAQLLAMLAYKARMAGVPVVEVDPRKTSQRCSQCGHEDRANRPKQAVFKCKACAYSLHADVNAVRNIAKSLPEGYRSSGVGRVARPLRGEVRA